MAIIAFNEADVAMTAPMRSETYNTILLSSGVVPGKALYQSTTGAFGLTSALASGTAGFRGVALQRQPASGTISYMRRGRLWGYDVSGMDVDDWVYLHDQAGVISTTPGTISVVVGRVMVVNEFGPNQPRVIYFDAELANASELG